VSVNPRTQTRRQFIAHLGMLGGALGLAPLLQACGGTADSKQREPDEAVVEMTDVGFQPDLLTITIGQSVVWRNTGSMVHTTTSDPDKAQQPAHAVLPEGARSWDSGLLREGESWRHTFEVVGDYTYFCIPHEAAGMVGRIVVKG
jgi:plastocyanin